MASEVRPLVKCSVKREDKKLSRALYKNKLLLNSCIGSIMKAKRVPRNKHKRINTVPKSPRCRLQKLKVIIVRHF